MSYEMIRQAIIDRESLTATYDRCIRLFSPHVWGKDRAGARVVLAFQYGGGRRGGLPMAGDWICFGVDGLAGLARNGDTWIVGSLVPRSLHLVTEIDVGA